MTTHETHGRGAKWHFELWPTYLNSKTPHPAEKDWGLCHLVHGIVTQDISLAAGKRRRKGRDEHKKLGIEQEVIGDCWLPLCVRHVWLLWTERPPQVMMYRQNKLACKESHQSPWSLQPCWSGDGEDPAIGETTAVPVRRERHSGSQHG